MTQTQTKNTTVEQAKKSKGALRREYPYSYQIVGRISEPLTVLRGNCSSLPSIVAIFFQFEVQVFQSHLFKQHFQQNETIE